MDIDARRGRAAPARDGSVAHLGWARAVTASAGGPLRRWAIEAWHSHLLQHTSEATWACLAVAAVLVGAQRTWRRFVRYGITAVHEIGHAAAAVVLVGRARITLRADTSGETRSRRGGAGRGILVAMAGYPAPGVVGLVGAALVADKRPAYWLDFLVALGLVSAVAWVRNLFGALVFVVWTAVLLVALEASGSPEARSLGGLVLLWVFALGGARSTAEAIRHRSPGSDAAEVAQATHLPLGVVNLGLALFVLTELAAAGLLLAHGRTDLALVDHLGEAAGSLW